MGARNRPATRGDSPYTVFRTHGRTSRSEKENGPVFLANAGLQDPTHSSDRNPLFGLWLPFDRLRARETNLAAAVQTETVPAPFLLLIR